MFEVPGSDIVSVRIDEDVVASKKPIEYVRAHEQYVHAPPTVHACCPSTVRACPCTTQQCAAELTERGGQENPLKAWEQSAYVLYKAAFFKYNFTTHK
jgi:hypothetical protein